MANIFTIQRALKHFLKTINPMGKIIRIDHSQQKWKWFINDL